MSINDITEKIRKLKEAQAFAAEIAAEIETLQDEIKAEMTTRNTDTLQADIFTVRWTTVKSARLDSKALKAEEPELLCPVYQNHRKPPFLGGVKEAQHMDNHIRDLYNYYSERDTPENLRMKSEADAPWESSLSGLLSREDYLSVEERITNSLSQYAERGFVLGFKIASKLWAEVLG